MSTTATAERSSVAAEQRTITLTRAAHFGHIVIGAEPLNREDFDTAYNALHRIEAGGTDREYEASHTEEAEGTDLRILVNSDISLLHHGRNIFSALEAAGVEVVLDEEVYPNQTV